MKVLFIISICVAGMASRAGKRLCSSRLLDAIQTGCTGLACVEVRAVGGRRAVLRSVAADDGHAPDSTRRDGEGCSVTIREGGDVHADITGSALTIEDDGTTLDARGLRPEHVDRVRSDGGVDDVGDSTRNGDRIEVERVDVAGCVLDECGHAPLPGDGSLELERVTALGHDRSLAGQQGTDEPSLDGSIHGRHLDDGRIGSDLADGWCCGSGLRRRCDGQSGHQTDQHRNDQRGTLFTRGQLVLLIRNSTGAIKVL